MTAAVHRAGAAAIAAMLWALPAAAQSMGALACDEVRAVLAILDPAPQPPPFHSATDHVIEGRADGANLEEQLDGLLFGLHARAETPGVALYCAYLRATFTAPRAEGAGRTRLSPGAPGTDVNVPIVVLSHGDGGEVDRFRLGWEAAGHDIPLLFNTEGADGSDRFTIRLQQGTFNLALDDPGYGGSRQLDPDQVRFFDLAAADAVAELARALGRPADHFDRQAPWLILLCQSGPCEETLGFDAAAQAAVQDNLQDNRPLGAAGDPAPPPIPDTSEPQAPGAQQLAPSDAPAEAGPTPAGAAATADADTVAADASGAAQPDAPQPDATATPSQDLLEDQPPDPGPRLLLAHDPDRPEQIESAAVSELVEPLICYFAGYVGPPFDPTGCDSALMDSLAGHRGNVVIELVGQRDILIRALPATTPSVAALDVRLPANATAGLCRVDVAVPGGPAVEAVGSDPGARLRTARFDPPLPAPGGTFQADLQVSDPADCGATGRSITVAVAAAGARPEVALAAGQPTRRASIAVIATGDTDWDLLAEAPEPSDRAAAILTALEAGHRQAARTGSGRPWALDRADVIGLQAGGTPRLIATLDGSHLTDAPRNLFAQPDVAAAGAALTGAVAVNARSLLPALRPRIEALAAEGVEEVMVTILGDVAGANACDPVVWADLARGLSQAGTEVRVVSMPFVVDRPGAVPPADSLVPLGFRADLGGGRRADLFLCRLDATDGVVIRPFVTQPWRSPADQLARYAAALGGRLGLDLLAFAQPAD